MSPKPYIVGISGGKKNGHTSQFLSLALEEANNLGANAKLFELSDYNIKTISQTTNNPEHDESLEFSDDMHIIAQELLSADGIIFASPVHWFGVSSEMKILIDRLTPFENKGFLLESKVCGFIVYGNEEGRVFALTQMAAMANHMGMIVPPYAMLYLTNQESDWASKDILLLPKNMIKIINCVKQNSLTFGYE